MNRRISSFLRVKSFSVLIVYLASVILLLELLRFRFQRTSRTDVPYFSPEFLALFGVALALAGVSIWAVRRGNVVAYLVRAGRRRGLLRALGVVVLGYLALAASAAALPSLKVYAPPFLFWWLLVCLALMSMALAPSKDEVASAWLKSALPVERIRANREWLVLIALSVVVPLVVLEIGFRIWFTHFGTERERIIYTYSWEDITRLSWRLRGLPYLNYGLSPDYSGHNSLGYRGTEVLIPKPEGVFRIVALGGSTTYGDLLENWQDAYPAQLERALRETYGYTQVEVINAGVPSYSSWEILVNLEFRVLDLEPNLVIFYEAVNDLGSRVYPPEYYSGLSASAAIWRTDAPPLSPFVLYRYLAINLGWMVDPSVLQYRLLPQFPEVLCCERIPHEELARRIEANPPIYLERNLRNLIAVAQANDVEVMLSSWAYFPDATEGTGFNLMTLDYRQEAIAEHNATIAQLAQEFGVPFYDLSAQFPYDRDFWFGDGVHMTALGTQEQAAQYGAFLVDQGLLPPK